MSKTRTINQVILVGFVCKDGVTRWKDNGRGYASIVLMTESFRTAFDGSSEQVYEYHRIVVWNDIFEEIEELCKKGILVMVRGFLKTTQYIENNQTKYITQVIANEVSVIDESET